MANERTPTGQSAPINTQQPDTMGEMRNEARSAADEIKTEASHQMDKAKSELASGVDRAGREARGFATDQKDYAAGQLGSIADAVSRVSNELEGDQPTLARYAREIGNGMRGLSDTARDSSVDELVNQATRFGRQNPAAFLGAAALLGFAASRFLTASAHRHETTTRGNGIQPSSSTH